MKDLYFGDATFGFIGFGNMAQAIVTGLINSIEISGKQIFACAAHYDKLCHNAKKLGIQPKKTALEVVENSQIVILAVKPYLIEEVVAPIKKALKGKILVSVAAGCYFDFYEKILEKGTHHISTIPNTPVAVNEGIYICEKKHSFTEAEFKMFEAVFGLTGLIEMVETKDISIAGTISGCAPAFTAMYIEALGDAGVKYGLTREAAYRLASQMMVGTGKLYLEKKEHPGMMKDAVCSPGGTTIKGVTSLEKNAFKGVVIEAIDEIEGV